MTKKKVAINGFGRIGRLTFRKLIKNDKVEIVGINDLSDPSMLAHLLKYDTAQGGFDGEIRVENNHIIVDGHDIEITAIRNPEELPWKEKAVDVVLECTGIFRTSDKAGMHLTAGAKKVIISAPAKSDDVPTVVLGVNDDEIDLNAPILSNASCTTNCLAPMVKIINDNWGWHSAVMTTTHAYTGAQNLQDGTHKDWRRARAAAQNIVPTTTGSAAAVGKVIPAVKGKMIAMALRVPVITGSMVELVVHTDKTVTADEVNQKVKEYAEGGMNGILEYQTDPIVSSDIIGNSHSSIFDSLLTEVNGDLLRIVTWYDNEAGYSSRLADLVDRI